MKKDIMKKDIMKKDITIFTSRIGSESNCQNPIDITAKSASTKIGKLFAPSYNLLMDYKSGGIDQFEYTDRYEKELEKTFKNYNSFRILDNYFAECNSITLICYCGRYSFCHRNIVKEFLKEYCKSMCSNFIDGGFIE